MSEISYQNLYIFYKIVQISNRLLSKGLYPNQNEPNYVSEFHSLLNGLKNLEFLDLACFGLINYPFHNLANLRKLSLNDCDFSQASSRLFEGVACTLEIFEVRFPQNDAHIDYKLLFNLKRLIIEKGIFKSFQTLIES